MTNINIWNNNKNYEVTKLIFKKINFKIKIAIKTYALFIDF